MDFEKVIRAVVAAPDVNPMSLGETRREPDGLVPCGRHELHRPGKLADGVASPQLGSYDDVAVLWGEASHSVRPSTRLSRRGELRSIRAAGGGGSGKFYYALSE